MSAPHRPLHFRRRGPTHATPLVATDCGSLASCWRCRQCAQQEAVHWHHDLESAKIVAKETKRLVLVHFWTPSCGPCMALDQNVFNQPGVASAIETQFVPVKLNADENSATALVWHHACADRRGRYAGWPNRGQVG